MIRPFPAFALFCMLLICQHIWSAGPNNSFDDAEDEVMPDGKGALNVFIDSLLKKPGFSLYADYSIMSAYYPGWSRSIWEPEFKRSEILRDTQPLAIEMHAKVGLDIRLSPELNFWQAVKFSVPGMKIELIEFYGEYIFLKRAFFKIGKYDYSWGVSPNFDYANLLARIPNDTNGSNPGDLYIARSVIPINIGGLELIAFTRNGYINTDQPELNEFAFGGKFNLALRQMDINLGSIYFKRMPWRVFFSLKSTIFNKTEIYAESLLAINHYTWQYPVFSCSFGFYNDFLDNKFRLNGEVFYNGESDALFLRKEPLEDQKNIYPFIPGINMAVNVDYRHGDRLGLRSGIKFLYAFKDGSGQVIPGVSLEPAKHLNIYFAVPFVVGRRSGEPYSYYIKNNDKKNRPISFVLAISINGAYEFAR